MRNMVPEGALLRRTWLERLMSDERPEQVTTTEARAGYTPHMTRYVLGVGLALVVVLFAVIYLISAP
jgi:hypothetical protein